MENSLTGEATATAASVEPTAPVEVAQPSAETNQETISTPETVSETTTAEASTQEPNGEGQEVKQTETKAVVEETDDGLAKFAKSQGFDLDSVSDNERRLLKIAHDNTKDFRRKAVAESKASVDGEITTDEIESFRQEFRQYQATKQAEQFFMQEGRDDSLAPVMSEIIEEKKLKHGVDFARELAGDLDLLYDLARVRSGLATGNVDPEQIRREERESINRNLSAASGESHATTSRPASPQKITAEWIRNEYDPRNPEHLKMMSEAGLR